MQPILILSAGHSPLDPGAIAGVRGIEYEITTSLCWEIAGAFGLLERARGVAGTPVAIVPTVSLNQKLKWVNALSDVLLERRNLPHWALEIHVNAHTNTAANGVEAWHWPSNTSGGYIANELTQAAAKEGFRNRGRKGTKDLYWIRKAKCASVLLEVGFITNAEDRAKLVIGRTRAAIARRVATAIMDLGPRVGETLRRKAPSPIVVPDESGLVLP